MMTKKLTFSWDDLDFIIRKIGWCDSCGKKYDTEGWCTCGDCL